jgi:alkanesulfonate monooxygenase SsuD/methylene tetrahydromethanopterin reductase-like flavin-dependent oxidoreductase (luciferase family)
MPQVPKIGITLPTIGSLDSLAAAGGVAATARHVEDLGFESIWIADLITGDGMPSLDVTTTVATSVAVTERVLVGFGTLVPPLRPTALIAAQVASLQWMSRNRILLGVGTGGIPDSPFWPAVGSPAHDRGRRTDAALAILPSLLAGTPTKLDDVPGQPVLTMAPAVPMPPLLVGGNTRVARRRAVTFDAAWFPSLSSPQTVANGAAELRALAADRGLSPPDITFATHAVLGDDEAARGARRDFVRNLVDNHRLTPAEAERVPVGGPPAAIAERFAEYAAAGAQRIVLAIDGDDWLRKCELVARARDLVA